jgi:glutaredoxin
MASTVVMYARERYCPDVARARARLSHHALSWTEHDIESDDSAAAQVQALTGQRRVPTIVIGTSVLVEPSDAELDAALAAAGILDTALPAPTTRSTS